ncbi:hypothetical protein ElyMa_000319200 [Elysia marginata]|uniref:Uncharacterized protein n=1 Tax=Elysia marginata TaxID=1093978 RepID=A0AAV4FAR6_9GAST|nr:hypothetical protein ElyMa_000319200 [Elysia marginata]
MNFEQGREEGITKAVKHSDNCIGFSDYMCPMLHESQLIVDKILPCASSSRLHSESFLFPSNEYFAVEILFPGVSGGSIGRAVDCYAEGPGVRIPAPMCQLCT